MARPRNKVKSNYNERWQTLNDLRTAVAEMRAEATKMLSHLRKMIDEYGDFEDKINVIDKHITQASIDIGITEEEVFAEPEDSFIDLSQKDSGDG